MRYPGAVQDPDTGEWISDAGVAEAAYMAFTSTTSPVIARSIVRRVKDVRHLDTLFPAWRYHPFFTDARHRRQHHASPPRHHRSHLLRPHRRPLGTHSFRAFRSQRRLGRSGA